MGTILFCLKVSILKALGLDSRIDKQKINFQQQKLHSLAEINFWIKKKTGRLLKLLLAFIPSISILLDAKIVKLIL